MSFEKFDNIGLPDVTFVPCGSAEASNSGGVNSLKGIQTILYQQ